MNDSNCARSTRSEASTFLRAVMSLYRITLAIRMRIMATPVSAATIIDERRKDSSAKIRRSFR